MRSLACAVLALLVYAAALAQEPLSRQLSLTEMTQQAGTIVHGQIISSRLESHPQFRKISTLAVTLRVIDPIYGTSGRQVTYRLFLPPQFRSTGKFSGQYRVGEELIIFMHPTSQYGFTSPVGGDQGRFQVEYVDGHPRVINSLNNAGLFADLGRNAKAQGRSMTGVESALSSHESGAVTLDDFKVLVRQLAANKVSK